MKQVTSTAPRSGRGRAGSAADIRPLVWAGDRMRILDQTALPLEERWLEVVDVASLTEAIRRLAVRGAPLLGVAAGYGMALAAVTSEAGYVSVWLVCAVLALTVGVLALRLDRPDGRAAAG